LNFIRKILSKSHINNVCYGEVENFEIFAYVSYENHS
jgi:hypothetical protein